MIAIKFRFIYFLFSFFIVCITYDRLSAQDVDEDLNNPIESTEKPTADLIDQNIQDMQLRAIQGSKIYNNPAQEHDTIEPIESKDSTPESNNESSAQDDTGTSLQQNRETQNVGSNEPPKKPETIQEHEQDLPKHDIKLDSVNSHQNASGEEHTSHAEAEQPYKNTDYYPIEPKTRPMSEPEDTEWPDQKPPTDNQNNTEDNISNKQPSHKEVKILPPKFINCYFGDEIRDFKNPILGCKASVTNYLKAPLDNKLFYKIEVLDNRFNRKISQDEGYVKPHRSSWPIVVLAVIIASAILIKVMLHMQFTYIYTTVRKRHFVGIKQLHCMQNSIVIYTATSFILSLIYGYVISGFIVSLGASPLRENYLNQWMFISALILLFFLFRFLGQKVVSSFFETKNIFDICFCTSINTYLLSIITLLPIMCLQILSVNFINTFMDKLLIIAAVICNLLLYVLAGVYTLLKTKSSIIDLIIYLCIFEVVPIILIYKTIEFYTIYIS